MRLTHPLGETYDRPHGASEGAAAAEASAEEPPDVDGQCLPQRHVDPAQRGLELLRRNPGVQRRRVVAVKPIRETETKKDTTFKTR